VTYAKAHNPDSCGYDTTDYTRVHRDRAIINAMRGWMHLPANVPNAELGLSPTCQ
jgi:hypothetical protein